MPTKQRDLFHLEPPIRTTSQAICTLHVPPNVLVPRPSKPTPRLTDPQAFQACNQMYWSPDLLKTAHVPRPTGSNLHVPGHHFVAVSVGVLRTNSCVVGSYAATVSSPRTLVPAHKAKHPHLQLHPLPVDMLRPLQSLLQIQTNTRTPHKHTSTGVQTFRHCASFTVITQ